MSSEIKVSIITPCYNAGPYIRQTIESVLAQDYPHWEMLITDDNSTDDTVRIVQEYACKDSRIQIFVLPSASGSPASPRNFSLLQATGKYVAFLDADDIWEPNKLSEQVAFAEENNYSIVYSYYEKITNTGERNYRIIKTDAWYDYKKIIKTDGVPWLTLMVRRDIIGDLKFTREDKEDYVFLVELLKKGYTAYNTCKIHALYREAIGSRSGNKLKMLIGQWKVIRNHTSLSIPNVLYCMIIYSFQGLKKYLV